jgi:DNA-binding NtrC family response regulator
MQNDLRILLVEDDLYTQKVSKRILSRYGEVEAASTKEEAKEFLTKKSYDVAFLDLNLHGELDGLNLIKLTQEYKTYPVVVSGETDKQTIQKSLEFGARDYLLKPFDDQKLDSVITRYFLNKKELALFQKIRKGFITRNESQAKELSKIVNLSISDRPIFIDGETGTGKRVVAHLIKETLGCDNFIEVNCSQFTGDTTRSELFGHKAGSFTGANADKVGLLQKAHGGILFMDEVHALSPEVQKLLLKAIEEKVFYPMGSNIPVKSDFRIVSATCEDIHALISEGKFREDLFARISTFQIKLFPLRERSEDIMPLFDHFKSKQPFQMLITDEAQHILKRYSWPRNTREVQDLLENWVVNGHRLITVEHIPQRIKSNLPHQKKIFGQQHMDLVEDIGLKEFMNHFKKEIINEFLKKNGGNLRQTAKAMRIAPSTLSEMISAKEKHL